MLSDFAVRADQGSEGIQWSFRRTFGSVRVVVIDSRAGRVMKDGTRLMVSEAEWQWVTESVSGDWDHVVLATSLPLLLAPGIHALEAWNEAICAGAWGKSFARAGERVRRAMDLEHWAAFGRSFEEFGRLLAGLATGAQGRPPASVTVISGDVHHSYLAAVSFPAGTHPRSAVYQAVCSPIHNVLPNAFRRGHRVATSRAGELLGTALARLAGVSKPKIRWRITHGPWFDNMLCPPRVRRAHGADPLRAHDRGPGRDRPPGAGLRDRTQLSGPGQDEGWDQRGTPGPHAPSRCGTVLRACAATDNGRCPRPRSRGRGR